jgi:hypothetical protein
MAQSKEVKIQMKLSKEEYYYGTAFSQKLFNI